MAGRVVAIAPAGRRDGTGVSRLARRRCFSPGAVATAPARVPARGGPARAPPPRLAVRAAYPGKGQGSLHRRAPARALRRGPSPGRALAGAGDAGEQGPGSRGRLGLAGVCARVEAPPARVEALLFAPGWRHRKVDANTASCWRKVGANTRLESAVGAPGSCAWRLRLRLAFRPGVLHAAGMPTDKEKVGQGT